MKEQISEAWDKYINILKKFNSHNKLLSINTVYDPPRSTHLISIL